MNTLLDHVVATLVMIGAMFFCYMVIARSEVPGFEAAASMLAIIFAAKIFWQLSSAVTKMPARQ